MTLPSTLPHVLGETSLDRFDALVIGSGAGGSAITWALASQGRRVLVLEAGDNHFDHLDDPARPPISRFSNDEVKMGPRHLIEVDPLIEPRTFRPSEADGARTMVGDVNGLPKTVGGAGVHADLKMVRFQPTDFMLGALLGEVSGASFADWPITYDQLEPFYAEIEARVGVSGMDGADPFAAPRSTPYPMPPGLPMLVATILGDAASRLGYTPFPYPSAVNTEPYRDRPACVDCGFCSGYGCPSNAKGSPAVTLLRDALLTGNVQVRFNAPALRLIASGASIDAVEYRTPEGDIAQASADLVVLAASPIEDARLCLLSDPSGPGLGNASGLVGRNLMFHFQTLAIGIYPQRMHGHRGRAVTHGISDFRGVPGDPARPLGGIVELATSAELIGEAKEYAFSLGKRGDALSRFMEESPLRDHLGALIMQAEDAPQATNRVDLDPEVRDWLGLPVARVTYTSHAFELGARETYGPRLLDIHREAGAQYGFVAPYDSPSQSRHVMGTLRMGSDPAASVCDPSGRFHAFDNLYCADGALFPTSSGFNPILTIEANALRVGGEIVFPGSPERILTTR